MSRLNLLPENPSPTNSRGRFPAWLHRPLPTGNALQQTENVVSSNRLYTVCEEARCPNLSECWSKKTATFLVLGKECTRSCGFCSIDFSKTPKEPDPEEPERVAASVRQLGLQHVVITMVARDDLPRGGAEHLASVVRAIRASDDTISIEVLTSDFSGSREAWDLLLEARPNIFNHNVETVRRLVPRVRHKATYERSLELLSYVAKHDPRQPVRIKSGLMVGLGEREEEVYETLRDLQGVGCSIVTIGQYLQSKRTKLSVKAFITPEQFAQYAAYGSSIGIRHVYSAPFVRSSYNASLFA